MKVAGQRRRVAAMGALVVLFAACNGDGGTEAPRATSVVAASPTTQTGVAGTPVAEAPAVRVTDQNGQAMAGVAVTFVVTAGGGALTGASATTNAQGVATAGTWTLGTTPGQNVVTATAANLAPVQFTASAQDPCDVSTLYTPLTTISGAFIAADCRLSSGEYMDFYDVALTSAQAISFRMSSSQVDTWLEVYGADGDLVAVNDDDAVSTNSEINLFAPSGSYFLAATTFEAGELGSYQLSSAAFAGAVNCNEYWMVPGIIVNGTVANTDCTSSGYYSDLYYVVLQPGEQLTVQMESSAFDALLELYDAISGELVAENDDFGGTTNARIVYTATELSVFAINATTWSAGAVGAYTLTVTSTGGDGATVLQRGQLPAGLLDAANAAARDRGGDGKVSAARGSLLRGAQLPAPKPRVKSNGTR